MSKRVTRQQIRSWLGPMRRTLSELRSDNVDSIKGYAMTKMPDKDEYARIDFCMRGFRGLIERLLPTFDSAPIARIEKKLAMGSPLTIQGVDAGFAFLTRCENALIKKTVDDIKSAVKTEEIQIEIDRLRAA